MHILVTGGAGYIGSHIAVELMERGHHPIILDNFVNSHPAVLERLHQITGHAAPAYIGDIGDIQLLVRIFREQAVDAVIHLAGLKSVGQSVVQPLAYYRANLAGTLTLLEAMTAAGVKHLIFSSTAAVYGAATELPLLETSPAGAGITNPYARTKFMIEQLLRDLTAAEPEWAVTILRYFNPIGAHASGLIGEDPIGPPANLVPYVSQAAAGRRPAVRIFGADYDTVDGTGVRDYIHVVDLARGHVTALEHLAAGPEPALYNLGVGRGSSVLEVLAAFEAVCGHPIARVTEPRRPGDVAASYADTTKAAIELGWHATKTLADACSDAWRWQSRNPDGYPADSRHT